MMASDSVARSGGVVERRTSTKRALTAVGLAAAVGVVMTGAGYATTVVPGVGDWFKAHPQWGPARTIFVIMVTLLLWVVIGMRAQLTAVRAERDDLQRRVEEMSTPPAHDQRLFADWVSTFATDDFRGKLRDFYPRQWLLTSFGHPIVKLSEETWPDRRFVSRDLQSAYEMFFSKLEDFGGWLVGHGTISGLRNGDLVEYQKPDARTEEAMNYYYEEEKLGSQLRWELLESINELEHLGHQKGL